MSFHSWLLHYPPNRYIHIVLIPDNLREFAIRGPDSIYKGGSRPSRSRFGSAAWRRRSTGIRAPPPYGRCWPGSGAVERYRESGQPEPSVVMCSLEPGQASFHHGWTLHSSMPNRSDDRRIGVNMQELRRSPARTPDSAWPSACRQREFRLRCEDAEHAPAACMAGGPSAAHLMRE